MFPSSHSPASLPLCTASRKRGRVARIASLALHAARLALQPRIPRSTAA